MSASCGAGHGKIGVQGFAAQRAASTTPADSESGDAESIGSAGHAQARRAQARRRRIGTRLLMLAIVALGLGAIGALAFAWSNADGPLRFELQSAATAPKSARPAAAQEEIERLRGELDALKNDVKELTEAQHQAAHTVATMKAAEEDLRRDVPPPYWYSNPATLDLAIANKPESAVVVPPPRRPAAARSESRGLRKREGAAPASPASPQ